ncbi:NADPH:quinone reductase-like Zn-dependent oxidoreductase [Streptomyces albogriseolus]
MRRHPCRFGQPPTRSSHCCEILREAAALVDEGTPRPLLDGTRYTLADVADAHRSVESGTADGKVVVDVEP